VRPWSIFPSHIISIGIDRYHRRRRIPSQYPANTVSSGEDEVQQIASNDRRIEDRFTETWTHVSRHHEEFVQHDGLVVRVFQRRRPAIQLQRQPADQLQRRARRPQEAFVGGPASELWGQQTKELGPGCGAWPAPVRRPPSRSSDKTYL